MIYAISNRTFFSDQKEYLAQIESVAAARPDGFILREKDLNPEIYKELAQKCKEICDMYHVPLIVNTFWQISLELGIKGIHLSMSDFKKMKDEAMDFSEWNRVGVSVHSPEEAIFAQNAGADYLIAGHIFLTDCKKGLPARGLGFLSDICSSVTIPVFAIGGMNEEHGHLAVQAGASGVCMMSELMKSRNPKKLIEPFAGKIKAV